ncbi:MAG: hypothetical protein C5B53_03470 [Candidatus Melainabacteria bacterium]|nr:MAG: hypothetical protein C5B53_03470 [Candidatus Melainabacteria bacterium]
MSTTLVAGELMKTPDEQEIAYSGSNRRATSMLPTSQSGPPDQFQSLTKSDYQRLLLSIQNKRQSCCLQIESETNKSRSAILIFRGRILGCIYGKQGLQQHVFNEAAYVLALKDLASADHTITIYSLDEELVIAAAALFHGKTIEISEYANAQHIFDFAHDSLVQFNMPGSISIVGENDLSVCMVYIFAGKIVGVYSDKSGWTEPTYAAVRQHLTEHPGVRIRACMLPARNTHEVNQLTFKVSGIPDKEARRRAEEITQPLQPILPSAYQLKPVDLPKLRPFSSAIQADRFVPKRTRGASLNSQSSVVNHAFAVDP